MRRQLSNDAEDAGAVRLVSTPTRDLGRERPESAGDKRANQEMIVVPETENRHEVWTVGEGEADSPRIFIWRLAQGRDGELEAIAHTIFCVTRQQKEYGGRSMGRD